jgi:predicted secreted acid phosphatase
LKQNKYDMDNSAEIKTVSDNQFLQDLKILLRKCQLTCDVKGKQPAIVFDIDGTMVHDNTWDSPVWSVINFCNYCKDIGIATMIVTARGGWDANVNNTKNSLQELGVECDAMFFRKPDDNKIAEFKTNVRQYLSEVTGFNVLMSIGDNEWDMGQWGGVGVYMYAHPISNLITYQLRR